MSFIPKPHEIYKHFKGNLYQITAIAEHSETGEQLVVYQALYGDFKTYARPLNMFISRVDKNKYPNVEQEFRFELQGPDSARQKEALTEVAVYDLEKQSIQDAEIGRQVRVNTDEEYSDKSEAGRRDLQQAESEVRVEETVGASAETAVDESEELQLDPMVLEFLDADSHEERLNILAGLHHRITDEMITTMAISCDIEVEEGDTEERFESLRSCLLTLEKYECNRLR